MARADSSDAGVEHPSLMKSLALVVTGSVPGMWRASPLIDFSAITEARPDSAIHAALQGGLKRQSALSARACMDLPVAAALDDLRMPVELLPAAGSRDRHLALALASQFGHVRNRSSIAGRGENPPYNPVGCHSHSTPLHQPRWPAISKLSVCCRTRRRWT